MQAAASIPMKIRLNIAVTFFCDDFDFGSWENIPFPKAYQNLGQAFHLSESCDLKLHPIARQHGYCFGNGVQCLISVSWGKYCHSLCLAECQLSYGRGFSAYHWVSSRYKSLYCLAELPQDTSFAISR